MAQKRIVQNLNNAITPQQYEIGCQLLLITNMKSYGLSISTDLGDLEQHNSPYFVFFSWNSVALLAKYVTLVEYRPIMSVNSLPVPVFHFWP